MEYYLIYDLFAAAVLIGMVFAGYKKGFAGAVVSAAAVIVAFACAVTVSKPVTEALYKSMVEQPLENTVDKTLDEAMDSVVLYGIDKLDYDKVLVSGTPAGDVQLNFSGTEKVVVELSDLDLSETGIEQVDLTVFGIDKGTDFSSVNAKTADFTRVELQKHGLGKLAVAQYIAVNAVKSDFFEKFGEYTSAVGEALPVFLGSDAEELKSGTVTAVRFVVLLMTDGTASVKSAVVDKVVRPCFEMFAQTLVFIVVFAVISIVLSVVAGALEIVNKIPLLGKINALCGGLFGLLEGLVTLLVVCAGLRLIITLSGGNVVFINEMTIDETILFKQFYYFDLLNLLT